MPYRHLLCATDFSDVAERALERAVEIARAFGAELTVLHVIEHFPEDLPVGMGAREDQDPRQYLLDAARNRLATLLEHQGALTQARQRVIVSRQSARHEIIEAIKLLPADLLVTGTAPRGLLPHLGSTASGLLHATPCDLLVVKI